MRKRVAVITEDSILYNKIRLLLRGSADVVMLGDAEDAEGYYLVLADLRCAVPIGVECVIIGEGGDLPLCFLHEDLLKLYENAEHGQDSELVLSKDRRHVKLAGRSIKLTDLEYRLLEYLYDSEDYVSRSELIDKVWQGEHDDGIVNVYVHYLRQKLETDGAKIILSSRKYGYKLDQKYKRGAK